MELNKKKFASAAASVMGIIYIVCAVFVWLWPDFALQLLGWMAHLVNVDKFAGDTQITFGGLLAGLAQVLIYSYASAWLFAWLHNRSIKQ